MYARLIHLLVFAVCLCFFASGFAHAQQLLFNVPSPDVLNPGQLSISTTQNFRPWHTSSGSAAMFSLHGVYGLPDYGLGNMELGLSIGPVDYRHDSHAFADASLKWHPWQTAIGTSSALGLTVGDTVGFGVSGNVTGHVRNLLYAAPHIHLGTTGTRISAGPYYATRDIFDTHERIGAQITFEQSLVIIPNFALVADWQSGHNAFFTPGLGWVKNNLTLLAGYGFSNNGRKDDQLTFVGILTF